MHKILKCILHIVVNLMTYISEILDWTIDYIMHSPKVDNVFSLNISSVYLNNKHVFPTDVSPTTTTLTFVSIILASLHNKEVWLVALYSGA